MLNDDVTGNTNDNNNTNSTSWTSKFGRVIGRLRESRRKNRCDPGQVTVDGLKDQEADDSERQVTRYKPEGLDALCRSTKFSRKELQIMYRGFKNECPTGVVNEETFKYIYAQFFPQGDCSAYAHYVFNTFDQDHSGTISFEEFVMGLSLLLRGTLLEKLEWTFSLYDINGDGVITTDEMFNVVSAVYDIVGKYAEPRVDETTIRDHVSAVFQKMDTNKDGVITLDEFIDTCRRDADISRSMSVFDTIL
jgi:Ca2+-binding EF-hand superfamily protein